MSGFSFRFWPTLVALFLLCGLLTLGSWQLARLKWKTDLIRTAHERAHLAPLPLTSLPLDDLSYRHVTIEGSFVPSKTWFLNAPSAHGEGGARVLTPFILKGGGSILVDRGWVPWVGISAPRQELEPAQTQVHLEGFLWKPSKPWLLFFQKVPDDHFWTALNLELMAQHEEVNLSVPYLFIANSPWPENSLLKPPLPLPQLTNPHLGYAITWYTLAFILVVIYGISCRRE